MNEALIEQAAYYIEFADALLITAGAGMGVDSGLPDFRGSEGFWRAYPVARKMGYHFEDMANPSMFYNNPTLGWGFYGHRLNLYRKTIPHKGFEILLKWARQKGDENYFIYTSNVDGQFQKAGYDEDKIVECHGSIHHMQCASRHNHGIWSADGIDVRVEEDNLTAHEPLPKCQECGGLARPNILMFGDWDFDEARVKEQNTRFAAWLRNINDDNKKIVVIEMGAGTSIPTIRMLSENMSAKYRCHLIRINPREYDVPSVEDIGLPAGALDGLNAIGSFLHF